MLTVKEWKNRLRNYWEHYNDEEIVHARDVFSMMIDSPASKRPKEECIELIEFCNELLSK